MVTGKKVFGLFFTRAIAMFAVSMIFCFPAMASTVYWSLFNIEGESAISSTYVTYGTLADMQNDTNRLDSSDPNNTGFGRNVIGSGSDGTNYWSLFNIEGESAISSTYVTYATLADMQNDTNRLDSSNPNNTGFGRNVIGSGAFNVSAVPLPAALPLFGTGLAVMGFVGWCRKRKPAATA